MQCNIIDKITLGEMHLLFPLHIVMLFITNFTLNQIDPALILTIKSMIYLKSFACDITRKVYISVTLVQTPLLRFLHCIEPTYLSEGYNLALTQ